MDLKPLGLGLLLTTTVSTIALADEVEVLYRWTSEGEAKSVTEFNN
jgi:hypothetical protein